MTTEPREAALRTLEELLMLIPNGTDRRTARDVLAYLMRDERCTLSRGCVRPDGHPGYCRDKP